MDTTVIGDRAVNTGAKPVTYGQGDRPPGVAAIQQTGEPGDGGEVRVLAGGDAVFRLQFDGALQVLRCAGHVAAQAETKSQRIIDVITVGIERERSLQMLLRRQQVARIDLRDCVVIVVLRRHKLERLFAQPTIAHPDVKVRLVRDGALWTLRRLRKQRPSFREVARMKKTHCLLEDFKLRRSFPRLSDGG